jgi:hypothetical protein
MDDGFWFYGWNRGGERRGGTQRCAMRTRLEWNGRNERKRVGFRHGMLVRKDEDEHEDSLDHHWMAPKGQKSSPTLVNTYFGSSAKSQCSKTLDHTLASDIARLSERRDHVMGTF